MLRYLMPYLVAALVIAVAAGVGYGAGELGVPAVYALGFVATLIAGAGYVRWDSLQRHQRHQRSPGGP